MYVTKTVLILAVFISTCSDRLSAFI